MYIQVMTYTNDRASIAQQIKNSSKVEGRHYSVEMVDDVEKVSWILPKTPNFGDAHSVKLFRIPESEWDETFFDDIPSVQVLATMRVDENYDEDAFFTLSPADAALYNLAWTQGGKFCVFL